MEEFPMAKICRLPLNGAVKVSINDEIHCICHITYYKTFDVIQCSVCSVWFHCTCVLLTT